MSYTKEELTEIASNIEDFRAEKSVQYFFTNEVGDLLCQTMGMSAVKNEQLIRTSAELYIMANGKYEPK